MIKIAIMLEFAGSYGRGVLQGVMEYANLRADWEFLMPPMYSLISSTTGPMSVRVSSSQAAVRPAGPAPMMIAVRFSMSALEAPGMFA